MPTHYVPSQLQRVLWSSDVHALDINKDSYYIVHQILSHGSIEDINWLFSTYSDRKIHNLFYSKPYKAYRPARFNFIRTIMLEDKKSIHESDYVINTPRNLR